MPNKVGRFEGNRMSGRYWVGGCPCESGKEGREFYDRGGIYCGITCSSCRKDDPAKWAPGVMDGDIPYAEAVEEQIEED